MVSDLIVLGSRARIRRAVRLVQQRRNRQAPARPTSESD
jgi:hypothetical protein